MSAQYIAIAKVGYYALTDDSEECIPGNFHAIMYGLQALNKMDAQDYEREEVLWAKSEAALERETQDEVGAGAEGKVQVSNDFNMDEVGATL